MASPQHRTRWPAFEVLTSVFVAFLAITAETPTSCSAGSGTSPSRYIDRYPNPPEDIAAGYVERL